MKSNAFLEKGRIECGSEVLAQVWVIDEYKEQRIEKILNSVVNVKGRANVLMKELFTPISNSAVVIRQQDGSYLDPCDFGPYLYQIKRRRFRRW